ncbi:MAG: PASTA domain-containing protein [Actinobacteria bacterium]|nr:PASTA domain-containing protein [Actinomycetota bacterium]
MTAVGVRPPPSRKQAASTAPRITEVGPPEELDLARHPWAAVVGVVALLLLVVVTLVGLRAVIRTNAPPPETPRVVLPSITSMPVEQAQRQLDALGVEAAIEFTPNSIVPPGVVFSQTPRAGAKVESGSEVVLSVSDGPAGPIIPEVAGVQVPIAQALLGRLGLVSATQEIPNDLVRPGEVISSVPAAGSPAPTDQPILLRVSSGPPRRTVPGVVGESVGPGMAAIGRAGLGLGEVEEEARSDVQPGIILRVDPAPGSQVASRTPVSVVISEQAPSSTVPSLVGLTQATAEEVAGDAVVLRFRTKRLPAGDVLIGRVVEQSLPVGTPIAVGTPLELVVGAT